MQDIAYLTEQLDEEINKLSEQIVDCQKSESDLQEKKQRLVAKREFILLNEETYLATKKTNFTKKELLKKFGIGNQTFSDICTIGKIKPIDKFGKAPIYDLSQFEQAREDYKVWKGLGG